MPFLTSIHVAKLRCEGPDLILADAESLCAYGRF